MPAARRSGGVRSLRGRGGRRPVHGTPRRPVGPHASTHPKVRFPLPSPTPSKAGRNPLRAPGMRVQPSRRATLVRRCPKPAQARAPSAAFLARRAHCPSAPVRGKCKVVMGAQARARALSPPPRAGVPRSGPPLPPAEAGARAPLRQRPRRGAPAAKSSGQELYGFCTAHARASIAQPGRALPW